MNEQTEQDQRIRAELAAMQTIAEALADKTGVEIGRILRWACDRYAVAA